jgi:hypothetical protein
LRSIGEITFQLLADHRHLAPINIERNQKYTPNTAIWLFARDSKALDEIEQEDLVTILQASPPLKQAYDLIRLLDTTLSRSISLRHRLPVTLLFDLTRNFREATLTCHFSPRSVIAQHTDPQGVAQDKRLT